MSVSAAGLEAAARAAVAAALPRAADIARDPRAWPEGRLPAFAVTLTIDAGERFAMGIDRWLVDGTLTVEVWVVVRDAEDRRALRGIPGMIEAAVLTAPELDRRCIRLDAATTEVATSAERREIGQARADFALSWVDRAAPDATTAARFGLA